LTSSRLLWLRGLARPSHLPAPAWAVIDQVSSRGMQCWPFEHCCEARVVASAVDLFAAALPVAGLLCCTAAQSTPGLLLGGWPEHVTGGLCTSTSFTQTKAAKINMNKACQGCRLSGVSAHGSPARRAAACMQVSVWRKDVGLPCIGCDRISAPEEGP
jgi:hypothetical protein